MAKIKFRWRTNDGEIQFAQFEMIDGSLYLKTEKDSKLLATNIDSLSISQFVGCDIDKNEVYEGDVLIDKAGNKYSADLWKMAVGVLDCEPINGGSIAFKVKESE